MRGIGRCTRVDRDGSNVGRWRGSRRLSLVLLSRQQSFGHRSREIVRHRKGRSRDRLRALPSSDKDSNGLLRCKRALNREYTRSEKSPTRLLTKEGLIGSRVDDNTSSGVEAVKNPPLSIAHGILLTKESSVLGQGCLVNVDRGGDDGKDRGDVLRVEDDGGDTSDSGKLFEGNRTVS